MASLPWIRPSERPGLGWLSAEAAPAHHAETDVHDQDAALLASFLAGEPGSGGRLYNRLHGIVDATLVRVLGRREHDHADLVQTVFEQLVGTLSKGTFGRRCSLAGWASVLACHAGLNALRSRRRERGVIDRSTPREDDAGGPPEHADPAPLDARVLARDDLAAVRRHLGQMDSDRVTTLLLHAMGYELTEIAVLTSVSVAAAQSRLSRGRRELRARLDDESSRPSKTREAPTSRRGP